MNGAGAALTDAAAEFCADEIEMIAKYPQKGSVGGHVHSVGLAVYLQGEFTHGERNAERSRETRVKKTGSRMAGVNSPVDAMDKQKLQKSQDVFALENLLRTGRNKGRGTGSVRSVGRASRP